MAPRFISQVPDGLGTIEAKSVLLATGVRERPRAARLVPGHRPQGVFTTGSLQRFVYEHHLPVGKRAVIVGAERVSLSVVMTLMHAGVTVLNMITEFPHHQLYLPVFLPAKILFADILARALRSLRIHAISNIFGRQRVEGIEITDLDSGKTRTSNVTLLFSRAIGSPRMNWQEEEMWKRADHHWVHKWTRSSVHRNPEFCGGESLPRRGNRRLGGSRRTGSGAVHCPVFGKRPMEREQARGPA